MKTLTKYTLLLAAIIVAAALPSCHSARKAAATDTMVNAPNDTWTNVYMPVKTTLNKPMSMSLSGRATLARGQYIHLSMRFLGMEVAVLYMDTDSVYFVDKYHKYLFAEPIATVLGDKYRNMTLTDIQLILLGQKQFKATDLVSISPGAYTPTPAGDIAGHIVIKADTPHGDIDGTIEWSADDAKWNDPGRSVKFKMPSNYKRITATGLRSMLKSMSF